MRQGQGTLRLLGSTFLGFELRFELTLEPTAYRYRFIPVAGSTFTDQGTVPCH